MMKFCRGDNENRQSNYWKFGCYPVALRNSPLQTDEATNHSRVFGGLWLVAP